MATTKNRRTNAVASRVQAEATRPVKTNEVTKGNVIVARRLAFLGGRTAKAVAKEFLGGKSIGQFVEELDKVDRHSQAAYAVKQAVVEANPKMRLDPEAKAIKAARASGDQADLVWLSCRTGLTPGKVKYLLEA